MVQTTATSTIGQLQHSWNYLHNAVPELTEAHSLFAS